MCSDCLRVLLLHNKPFPNHFTSVVKNNNLLTGLSDSSLPRAVAKVSYSSFQQTFLLRMKGIKWSLSFQDLSSHSFHHPASSADFFANMKTGFQECKREISWANLRISSRSGRESLLAFSIKVTEAAQIHRDRTQPMPLDRMDSHESVAIFNLLHIAYKYLLADCMNIAFEVLHVLGCIQSDVYIHFTEEVILYFRKKIKRNISTRKQIFFFFIVIANLSY